MQARDDTAAADAGDAPSTRAATLAPDCGAQPRANQPKTGAELGSVIWLRGFDDASPVSAVAGDTAGNVLLARSGKQLLKLTAAGVAVWSRPFGALVATDGRDSVYVAGTLSGTLKLGTNVLRASGGGTDVYLAKLDRAGSLVYAISLGGAEDDQALSLAVDSAGGALISGTGLGTVKLDARANIEWTKPFSGRVALDSLGNALITGELTEPTDFGGGALRSAGGADLFVAKFSASGGHVFSRRFGDAAEQRGQAIAIDGADSVLIGGTFAGTLDFGVGALSLPAGTCPAEVWCQAAGFVAKFDRNGNARWSVASGPLRAVSQLSVDSQNNVLVSGAMPGGVSPFYVPVLFELDSDGAARWRRAEWPATGIGSGHGVFVDRCDEVLWSVSALPSLGADERPYLARLSQ